MVLLEMSTKSSAFLIGNYVTYNQQLKPSALSSGIPIDMNFDAILFYQLFRPEFQSAQILTPYSFPTGIIFKKYSNRKCRCFHVILINNLIYFQCMLMLPKCVMILSFNWAQMEMELQSCLEHGTLRYLLELEIEFENF